MGDRSSSPDIAPVGARAATMGAPDVPARRALVLGGGGVLGFAWILGALTALEGETGLDARDVDIAVGTSAGSVAAALLGCRLSVDVIARHHQGIPGPEDPLLGYDYASATGQALPPRPGWRPASPRLVLGGVLHPRRVPPFVTLSGLFPTGRGSLQLVRDLVAGVAETAGVAAGWPDAPRPWIVAVDYRTGRRIAFGREDSRVGLGPAGALRQAELPDAVLASCSIPGWYPPTIIDGVPYVDGGAVSNASVDLLRHTFVDEAYVFVPMASVEPDHPRTTLGRLERRVRRAITRRVLADVEALRSAGMRVCLVTPNAADLETMGVNLMNPARRGDVFDSARDSAAAEIRRQLGPGQGWGERANGARRSPGRTSSGRASSERASSERASSERASSERERPTG